MNEPIQPNHRFASRRRGSATTELALVLPFLGLMFTAAVDFGRVFQATQILNQCACAGAMYASGTAQTSSTTGPTQAATSAACAAGVSLSPSLQSSDVTVMISSAPATATVTVTYDFSLVTPILGPGSQVRLTRSLTVNVAPVPGN
jgi:Flp pilus assembly protein TadG